MKTDHKLIWHRGSAKIIWNGEIVIAPCELMWAADLPNTNGFAIVTLFDERTPDDVTNAFICKTGKTFQPLKITIDGILVRFLGCFSEGNKIVFNAANETEYLLNPETLEVESSRYYR